MDLTTRLFLTLQSWLGGSESGCATGSWDGLLAGEDWWADSRRWHVEMPISPLFPLPTQAMVRPSTVLLGSKRSRKAKSRRLGSDGKTLCLCSSSFLEEVVTCYKTGVIPRCCGIHTPPALGRLAGVPCRVRWSCRFCIHSCPSHSREGTPPIVLKLNPKDGPETQSSCFLTVGTVISRNFSVSACKADVTGSTICRNVCTQTNVEFCRFA